MKKTLVAVAWPYVNGDIHVGHLAGYLLPADVFTRYKRLRGEDVLMVSGSDCHGTPITVQADKENISPEEVVKKYHKKDIELFDLYNLDYSLYTKTTTNVHKQVVQDLFIDLMENEYIVKDRMNQYYSPTDHEFLPDRYVEGTCPYCKAEEQRSDQCESCGRWLKEGELIDPISKKTGEKVELKETEHYFLDFQKLESKLEKYLEGKIDGEDKKDVWRNWVYKEAAGWLKEGMHRRAITRDIKWGIELPIDKIPEEKMIDSIENKRIYVWFEAVIGYLSAPQEWSQLSGKQQDSGTTKEVNEEYIYRRYKGQDNDWEKWWFDKNSKHYYFMGQDNLVFHTLMWPGELIGAKKGYTLPYNVVVNKFMNLNSGKFSKSRGNVIDSREIAEDFGTDAVRYFILSNLPENKETNFTWERFKDANNNELVANLGNFINRTLVFYSKYFGKDPLTFSLDEEQDLEIKTRGFFKNLGERSSISDEGKFLTNSIHGALDMFIDEVKDKMDKVEIVNSVNLIMDLSSFGNKYFNDNKIWELVKNNPKDAEQVMGELLNIVEALRLLMRPFLPEAYERLTEMLGVESEEIEVGKNLFEFKPIKGYSELKKVKPLFRKIEQEEIDEFTSSQDAVNSVQLSREEIEVLLKPITIVKITKIEKHPDADRLLLVSVTDGEEENTIVTGADNIKEGNLVAYLGEGNVVPGWLINEGEEIKLEKKKIRGVESAGMILAEDEIGIGDDHEGIYILDVEEKMVGKSMLEILTKEQKDKLIMMKIEDK